MKGCKATNKKKVKQLQAVKPQINKFLGTPGVREARVDAIRFAKGIYLSKSLRMRKVAKTHNNKKKRGKSIELLQRLHRNICFGQHISASLKRTLIRAVTQSECSSRHIKLEELFCFVFLLRSHRETINNGS